MASRWLGRLPLRLRVALAFALTTAVALLGLGLFVQLRVADTLDEHLDETLESQLEQLAAEPVGRRAVAVRGVVGESFAQLLDSDGAVVASSGQVGGRLVRPGDPPDGEGVRRLERVVDLVDEDEQEQEPVVLLVQRAGSQVLVVGTPREDTVEALEEVRSQLLIGGPLALGLAAVLGYVVAGAGLRPIDRMRQRAATISDRSPGERLPLPTAHDELHRLGATLNAMLDRLEAGLERERRFVAEASHELRTPLALMRLELDLALSRPRPVEELTAALSSANEETARLIALAEDLLDLASADRDGLQLERRELDLRALAADVVRRFSGLAAETGRTVELRAGDREAGDRQAEEVRVTADADRLDQVISNLIDNALRHGAGTVEVEAAGSGDHVVLSVTDAGPGITEERPFDRFAGSRRGLGLSIVRAVVAAHDGTVTAGRKFDGTGTRVTVTLPRG